MFSKSFPRTDGKTNYPVWEEINLDISEERDIDEKARLQNINLMKQCIEDVRKIISDENLRYYQTDLVRMAVSLFEKRASHSVYWKEEKAKEKFDEKFKKE
jgi:predicted RNA-binding protein